MSQTPDIGSLTGVWTYRSFHNDPDLNTPYDQYLFGSGYLTIDDAPSGVFRGNIGDTGWSRPRAARPAASRRRPGGKIDARRIPPAPARLTSMPQTRTSSWSSASSRDT
jgi:hypothetical protein